MVRYLAIAGALLLLLGGAPAWAACSSFGALAAQNNLGDLCNPAAALTALGAAPASAGVNALAPTTHLFVTGVQGGTLQTAQPAFSDIAGAATTGQLPTGTSGATLPLNNSSPTESGAWTFSNSEPITVNDGAGHLGATALSFPTHAALAAYQPTNVGANMIIATTAGYTTAGDGGAATYVWQATSSASDSSGTFFLQPNGWSGNGRWELVIPPGGLPIPAMGQKCDGATDMSAGFNNRAAIATTLFPKGMIFTVLPGTTCYAASTITLGSGQQLVGRGNALVEYTASGGGPTPDIALAPTASVKLGYQSAIRNLYIARFGLPTAQPTTYEQVYAELSAWIGDTSIGVQIDGDQAMISNVSIVGFNKCVYSSGFASMRLEHMNMDCVNGVEITNEHGAGDLADVRATGVYVMSSSHYGLVNASVVSGGTGYVTGDSWTMSAAGASCTTLPTGTVVAAGGGVTSLVVTDTGSCSTEPSSTAIATTTGGAGSGLTFTPNPTFWQDGTRPGIGFYLHDGADGLFAHALTAENYDQGVLLSNVWEVTIDGLNAEAGANVNHGYYQNPASFGISLQNCTEMVKLSNIYAESTGIAVDFSQSNGSGACAGIGTAVTASNLSLSAPSTFNNIEEVHIGAHSQGIVNGLLLAGPAGTGAATVVVDALAGDWQISGVQVVAGAGVTTPWYSVASSSAPNVQILSNPTIVSLTSGASLAAACNQIIYVSDSTAPTITLPASCPLGQDIVVKDIGGLAGSHTITLAAAGGSTVDGGANATITANYGHLRVQFNGSAAALN